MANTPSSLRLIVDRPAGGAWNMAVDEALLTANGYEGLTLRFYQWQEPTLSLGYFQALADRDQHLPSVDCPVVRRASGGGAILHDHELTYSLVAPVSQQFGASTQQLYEVAHHSLCDVLSDWNISAHPHAANPKRSQLDDPFLCFQRRSPGDVILNGAKICGSAQRRHFSRVLQHGSVLLAASLAAPELPGLNELVSSPPEAAALREAWLARLVQVLRLSAVQTSLTKSESALAAQISEGKFSNPKWTAKR